MVVLAVLIERFKKMIELTENMKLFHYISDKEYSTLERINYIEKENNEFIQTFSGKKFYINKIRSEDICMQDISHALSMLNRFGGHSTRTYSVAEHSVRVSDLIWKAKKNKKQALYGLLHDASEIYISDIPSPFKRGPSFSQYREVEYKVQSAIYNKFGLDENEPSIVKEMDLRMLAIEASLLMSCGISDWNLPYAPDYEY